MAIVIKELVIKGKVVRDELPPAEIRDNTLVQYLEQLEERIIETCKAQVLEELERELEK